ncbi:MAG: virulence factor MviN [Brevibacterium sp.]|nr:virulence factor MviN [Brevibacterium sp.]MDN5834043.1 virulence factor MviN [Brevibacterium sp.]MDN5875608.1 virulence factor MviN [Brevibacterium sp.]MDN5908966.1 virulence factor MviN [Brevibacterium sp.]MDN6132572.1 virulence factor MviN [Brevibacterium sp.]
MVTLIDIEPGMVVAGRYVVSTVDRWWLEDKPQAGAVCTALDAILDEPMLIHVADGDGSTDVLEAARRVSILGDHRIAPTLDVGHSNGLDYVVSKRIAVTTLGEILPKSPLPIDAARALIGEIGTVMVTAARRGLFHMFLRPNTVGITTKGTVLVSGIGIDAALALGTGVIQPEDYTPTKASRADALGLIRLLYAAITGYWPADDPYNGIPAAGRENSRIARAKSLNPDISNELDDFVSGILTGSDPGPGSVAEVLGYLDEWDAELLRYVNRAPVLDNDSVFNQSPRSFDEATSLPTPRSSSMGTNTANTASDDQVKAALVRIGITRPGTRGLAVGVAGKTTGQYADQMQMREASSFPIGKDQLDNAAQDWEEWEPEQTYSQYSAYADHEYDENLTSPIMNRDAQDSDPDTQALDVVSEDSTEEAEDDNDTRVIMDDEDDGSWFLGGMFETNEQQREHQLREYERERRIAKAKEDEARRRIAALEAASTSKQQEANAATPSKQVRRLSPTSVDESEADPSRSTAPVPAVSPKQQPNDDSAAGDRVGSAKNAGTAAVGANGAAVGAGAAAGVTESSKATGSASKKGTAGKKGSEEADTSTGRAAAGSSGGATAGGAAAGGAASGGSANHDDNPDDDEANSRKPFAWLVLALVVVAAIVISIAVFNFNSGEVDPQDVAETSAPAKTDDGQDKKTEEPKPDPPKIDTVTALDPEGDNEENNAAAEDVIPETKGSWETDRYNTAAFGNLKSGLGLLFELEDKTTVKEVEVKSSNSGGSFEIRDGSDPEDSEKVGEGEFDSDGVTIKLDDGVETDNLILWVTELPPDEGGFRAVINTVDFK